MLKAGVQEASVEGISGVDYYTGFTDAGRGLLSLRRRTTARVAVKASSHNLASFWRRTWSLSRPDTQVPDADPVGTPRPWGISKAEVAPALLLL